MKLTRPLVVFDLETTGVDPQQDRVVELGLVTLHPDGTRTTASWLVNPGRRIPPGAIAVHGITDADVADAPSFEQLAPEVWAAFEGCDLSGFNAEGFDVKVLKAEFARIGRSFPAPDACVVDSFTIFRTREPRDLGAAVSFYCGRSHEGAHRAVADAEAAADVLLAQLERYPDLPREVPALHDHLHPRDPSWIDAEGKLAWQCGEAVITFGKHRDKSLKELVEREADYLRWMLAKDFPDDTKAIIEAALGGRYPVEA